jgi:hypothetical protein
MAYPETSQGFPATYEEIQQRVMQLLENAQQNQFLQQVLMEPDTMKVVARYILPDEIKLPQDAELARLKLMMQLLSKDKPHQIPNPADPAAPPILVPSMTPQEFDTLPLAVSVSTLWLQTNWQTAQTNPDGFENVLAFMRVAKQMATKEAIQQQLQMQAAQQQQGGGPQAAQHSAAA